MPSFLIKHSLIAICLAVFIEELGIPMPIPTDLLIVFAGAEAGRDLPRLILWFVLLSIASAAGASGLYMVVRRGGRPLVDRFGRYVHLGPEQLDRSERMLNRFGWFGIAIGRALPGLRYVTVIACGLLNVPYLRFITAHMVGSSVYIIVFLALGAIFGPAVAERIHIPSQALRLLWLLALSVGLPAGLAWLYYRSHTRRPTDPSRRRTFSAVLLAAFAGTTALSATWSFAAAAGEFFDAPRSIDVTRAIGEWLLGRGITPSTVLVTVYIGLLLICAAVGLLYYELILPLWPQLGKTMRREVFGLSLTTVFVTLVIVPALVYWQGLPLQRWWESSGTALIVAIVGGMISYVVTVSYGRALAITVLPSLRRGTEQIPLPSEPTDGDVTDGSFPAAVQPAADEPR